MWASPRAPAVFIKVTTPRPPANTHWRNAAAAPPKLEFSCVPRNNTPSNFVTMNLNSRPANLAGMPCPPAPGTNAFTRRNYHNATEELDENDTAPGFTVEQHTAAGKKDTHPTSKKMGGFAEAMRHQLVAMVRGSAPAPPKESRNVPPRSASGELTTVHVRTPRAWQPDTQQVCLEPPALGPHGWTSMTRTLDTRITVPSSSAIENLTAQQRARMAATQLGSTLPVVPANIAAVAVPTTAKAAASDASGKAVKTAPLRAPAVPPVLFKPTAEMEAAAEVRRADGVIQEHPTPKPLPIRPPKAPVEAGNMNPALERQTNLQMQQLDQESVRKLRTRRRVLPDENDDVEVSLSMIPNRRIRPAV